MSIPASLLRRVVTPEGATSAFSPADARGILEIACLAVASDGKLADEELAALRVLGAELRAVTPSELGPLVDAALNLPTREARVDRLRTLADALTTDAARQCAYRVSVATALSDLASADEEFEFDLDVQDALKLAPDVADRLTADVHEALIVAE